MYEPHAWVILKIFNKNTDEIIHKVLGSWRGGYLSGESWRMNSGISSVSIDGDYYLINGYSGSVYKCLKDNVGMGPLAQSVFNDMAQSTERLDIGSVEIVSITEIL